MITITYFFLASIICAAVFVGVLLGMLVLALCQVARREDE